MDCGDRWREDGQATSTEYYSGYTYMMIGSRRLTLVLFYLLTLGAVFRFKTIVVHDNGHMGQVPHCTLTRGRACCG